MDKSFQAPILLVIFNRPHLTLQVFNQIKKVKPKYLYIAADGPRANRPDDFNKCAETRKIHELVDWDCELKVLFREDNLGCGIAVSSAISWFFENVEAGIILEDDCFPDLSFFSYCSELLQEYKDDDRISCISGNNFQNGIKRGNSSYYYSHYPITWGWASWRRSWSRFDFDISDASSIINSGNLDTVFPSKAEKKFWIKKLVQAYHESQHIWDYHYLFSIWKNHGMCIIPNINLVINLGFLNDGTHHFLNDSTKTNAKLQSMGFPMVKPHQVLVNREADKYLFKHFYSHSFQRAVRLIKENSLKSILSYFLARINKGQIQN